jgi:hypothetical protein
VSAVRHLQPVVKREIAVAIAENWPLVPDGLYTANCVGYEAASVFRGFRIYFRFRIVDPGEHFGKVLFAAYPVRGQRVRQPGKKVWIRYCLHRRAWLYEMLIRVLGVARTAKAHEVRPSELVNKLCRIKTRTVVQDYEQQPLASEDQYSVVDDVLSCEGA